RPPPLEPGRRTTHRRVQPAAHAAVQRLRRGGGAPLRRDGPAGELLVQGPLPWLKPAVFTGALMPLTALGLRAAQGRLSADPIAYVLNQLGLLTLIFLIATL